MTISVAILAQAVSPIFRPLITPPHQMSRTGAYWLLERRVMAAFVLAVWECPDGERRRVVAVVCEHEKVKCSSMPTTWPWLPQDLEVNVSCRTFTSCSAVDCTCSDAHTCPPTPLLWTAAIHVFVHYTCNVIFYIHKTIKFSM